MIFTRKAQDKVVEIAASENILDPIVRVKVVGGGCAGFQHDMSFLEPDEMYDPDIDEVFEFSGFSVVIDPISAQYLEEAEVDYVSSEVGEGFKFSNAAVKSTCGCGSSVAF